jgi:hypothetical protein
MRAPTARRPRALDVTAVTAGGRLRVTWSHPAAGVDAAAVERAAAAYADELRALIAHCRASDGGYTPSDFPAAGVAQAELDRALAQAGVGPRGTVEDVYPLTPLQHGMLLDALRSTGDGLYHMDVRVPLTGVDPDRLLRAWNRVVERHPVLRTAFVWEGLDRPLQVVLRAARPAVHREDLRGLDAADAGARIDAYVAADRARGFAPDRAPLMRLALFRTGDDAWEMVWSNHHLLLDGWSSPRVFSDLAAFALADEEGREAVLPAAPRSVRTSSGWSGRTTTAPPRSGATRCGAPPTPTSRWRSTAGPAAASPRARCSSGRSG